MNRWRHPVPDPVGPGQESVWDYPRPPRLETSARHVRVELGGVVVADSDRALRVLETSHPPTYYVHPDDVAWQYLRPAPGGSLCEWKGQASYWTVAAGDQLVEAGAWSYRDPTPHFAAIVDHVAFYPARFRCLLDDEPVTPQPGGFYGGWVTGELAGPFKGGPGTFGW
ncbi:MAG TPA: DUF427 domain-containing protein [Ilumatobacter sp.]